MIFLVSSQGSTPLYLQIVRQVQTAVLTGTLRPGEALPSLRQLATETGVSLITTKRAYEHLESEGWVTTQPGRGTVIAALTPEFLQERKRRLVEEKLAEARKMALELGLERSTLDVIWKTLWETK